MTAPTGPSVADLVDAGLRRTYADMVRARAQHDAGRLTTAEWTATTARLYTRRARWWAVLDRATLADRCVHTVYMRAVLAATCDAERDARYWNGQAAAHAPEAAEQRDGVA